MIDGREYVVFCSNDYLGLAGHPELADALRRGADAHGVGSTAAHLVCGHHREHARLEEELADWTGRERALLFSTGDHGQPRRDAGPARAQRPAPGRPVRAGQAQPRQPDRRRARHRRRPAPLPARRRRRPPRGSWPRIRTTAALLATDGVFSMDGDIAPLADLAALCRREGATLMVDDAHGLGVLGPHGAGSLADAGLSQDDAPVLMGTLRQGPGHGGRLRRRFRRADRRPGAVRAQLRLHHRAAAGPGRRHARRGAPGPRPPTSAARPCTRTSQRFRAGAAQLGLPLMPSTTPIQPLLLGVAGTRHAPRPRRSSDRACWSARSARPPCPRAVRACASPCPPRTRKPISIGCWTLCDNVCPPRPDPASRCPTFSSRPAAAAISTWS